MSYIKKAKGLSKYTSFIIVFSSNKNVRDTIKKMLKREAVVLHKNNQGRDVSALLIGFQTYYEKYKYIIYKTC